MIARFAFYFLHSTCAQRKSTGCLGQGNGVSSGEGGEGGLGPPSREENKKSTPNKEGGNMEQGEEGRMGQV